MEGLQKLAKQLSSLHVIALHNNIRLYWDVTLAIPFIGHS